jgi:hypothetical protein
MAMRLASAMILAAFGSGACQSSDVSRSLGARCDVDSECDDLCLTGEPGGFCTTSCDVAGGCDQDSLCVTAPGSTDTAHGVCKLACLTDRDCAFLGDGYTCRVPVIVGDADPGAMVCDGL